MMEVDKSKIIRCRKCRHNLDLGHSIDTRCIMTTDSVMYIEADGVPDWILTQINTANWTKGKVNCQKCGGRLGSFDFTNIKQCQLCRGHDVSAVHIQKNRVDVIVPLEGRVGYKLRSTHDQPSQDFSLNANTHRYVVKPRQPFHISNSDRGTFDAVISENCCLVDSDASATCLNTPKTENPISRKSCSSETHLASLDVLSARLNETDYLEQVPETTFLVPTTICGSVLTSGVDQATIDNVSEDENPFTVLSGLRDQATVDGNEAEPQDDFSHVSRSGSDFHDAHVSEEQKIPEITYPDEYCCAVCMDLFYRPHSCHPCKHLFCESCLRRLARERPGLTPCPLCRNIIMECNFDQDLNLKLKTDYPDIYKTRGHNLRKIDSKFYRLPRCNRSQYYLANNANLDMLNQDNTIWNIMYQHLPCIVPVLTFAVLPSLLIYYLFTWIYPLVISLDSYVGTWSQESRHLENANFFIYNCFKLAIHGCSWYNLYHQAMQYRHWYQYVVFLMQFWSVIQMNLFRCVICTVSAEYLSRFFIQRQTRLRRMR